MDNKKIKKKILGLSIGIGAIAGIFAAGEIDDPGELLNNNNIIQIGEVSEDQRENSSEEKSYFADKIPLFLRFVIILPFWLLGNGLISLFKKMIGFISLPFWRFFLCLLITFVVLLIIVVMVIKLIYPDKSLKDIITKRLLLTVFIASIIIDAADILLGYFVEEYRFYRDLLFFFLGLLFLFLFVFPYFKRKKADLAKPKIIYEGLDL